MNKYIVLFGVIIITNQETPYSFSPTCTEGGGTCGDISSIGLENSFIFGSLLSPHKCIKLSASPKANISPVDDMSIALI